MTEEKKEHCPMCGSQCPKDNLHCSRGREYFAQQEGRAVRNDEKNVMELLGQCGMVVVHHKGQRGQGRILKTLAEQPEMSQKELQEKMNIQAGSLSEVLAKLEHKGFITRAKDENDKRSSIITLTEEGQKAAAEAKAKHEQHHGKGGNPWLKALSADEQAQLKALLVKLADSWDEIGADHHGGEVAGGHMCGGGHGRHGGPFGGKGQGHRGPGGKGFGHRGR